ncbi:flagellar basal-body rod protein FlgF [Chelatococcus sp. SYSU_G07232]|uniref:Flagellar basal-body rod protein FlgF n=1 Tax=Chelatococcus albus TaxID=3047466 RepID=A0ABT7AGE7_9HYPH|nr:flagellar basal-body rod protein FlgF [Chelatococcus sp. SYSU_G07232]MDJ1158450.1 flagellar basal-body rod protein FlgF [Chelatococcus sp. SYSU_G07232]
MENALLIGLSRQVALGRELDVVANNVANVTTNGFKARTARFREYLMPKASADAFQQADRRLSFVIDDGTPLNFEPGPIERTGNPLDVAIKGDAFLVVATPRGERYTRNGSLEINARGELVTSDGHAIQGENGPITFGNTETGITIAPDGTVTTNLGQRGKVRLVRFDDVRALDNEGANLFASRAPALPAGRAAKLEAGALERSNVKPVIEMARLIEVNRSYTSVASMIQKTDELRRSALSRLADMPA